MPQVRRMGYLLVLLIGTALATAMVWRPAPPAKFTGVASADIPLAMAGYKSPGDYEMRPEVKQALASADVVARRYEGQTGAIDFVLLGGTDRTALHDPRSCLIGEGYRLDNDHAETLPGTNTQFRSCRAVDQDGKNGFDILYLYMVDGKPINSPTQIRAAMLWSALIGKKNTPVYFLRFLQPLSPDSSDHARLETFAASMWRTLEPKVGAKSS